jgi:hypothetical protein
MTAINHALTGTLIGLVVGEPLLAVPAALVSHFVCDALPHFRAAPEGEKLMRTAWFAPYLATETLFCILLVLLLLLRQPLHWQLAAICAFVAAAPDLASYKRFRLARQNKPYKPGAYVRFASAIQWFERPIGWPVEVAWFIAAVALLVPFLR